MPTYYIDPVNGNDTTGTGASGAPWRTASKGVTSASETIHRGNFGAIKDRE